MNLSAYPLYILSNQYKEFMNITLVNAIIVHILGPVVQNIIFLIMIE